MGVYHLLSNIFTCTPPKKWRFFMELAPTLIKKLFFELYEWLWIICVDVAWSWRHLVHAASQSWSTQYRFLDYSYSFKVRAYVNVRIYLRICFGVFQNLLINNINKSNHTGYTLKNVTLYLRDITIYIKSMVVGAKPSFLLIQIVANSYNTINNNIS